MEEPQDVDVFDEREEPLAQAPREEAEETLEEPLVQETEGESEVPVPPVEVIEQPEMDEQEIKMEETESEPALRREEISEEGLAPATLEEEANVLEETPYEAISEDIQEIAKDVIEGEVRSEEEVEGEEELETEIRPQEEEEEPKIEFSEFEGEVPFEEYTDEEGEVISEEITEVGEEQIPSLKELAEVSFPLLEEASLIEKGGKSVGKVPKLKKSVDFGRSDTTISDTSTPQTHYIADFDITKDSKNTHLNKFLKTISPGEADLKSESRSLQKIFSSSGSFPLSVVKDLHSLYAQEKPPTKADEFAWPSYLLEDRDQIYENLLARTICNSNLMVLDKDHCLIRRDHRCLENKVKLLSGGKAGTDPLFAGYVGKGMLTAVVIGDRCEAPKVQSIFNAIEELSFQHKAGILIIVQNSYENRLTFGLAMQRARQKGVLIDMVTVSDDCFENQKSHAGRQGLAGILLTIKIAGGMAENGKFMKEIFMVCRTHFMATISGHILKNEFRVGTSIEPDEGISLELKNLKEVTSWLLQYITHPCRYFSLPLIPLNRIVLLVNSYTQDSMFLYSALAEIIRQLYCLEVDIERIYAGNFITSSCGERGLSITILKLYDESVLKWLDEPTSVESWPTAKCGLSPLVMKGISRMPPQPIIRFGVRFPPLLLKHIPHVLNYVCRSIMQVENMLNTYDKNFHLGSAIARGAVAVAHLNRTQTVDLRSAYSFLQQMAHTLEESMLGATGALCALMFDGAAQKFLCYSHHTTMAPYMWAKALESAVKNLEVFGKLQEGQCTMLDALAPAAKYCSTIKKTIDGLVLMVELAKVAQEGMAETKIMRSKNHLENEPEVGAYAVSIIFRAILEAVKNIH